MKYLKKFYNFRNLTRTRNVTPTQFLKLTYKEVKRNTDLAVARDKFNEKYLGRKVLYPSKPYKSFKDYLNQVIRKKSVNYLKNQMKKGKKQPVPFVEFNKYKQPIGHEGRHTAMALKKMGVRKIPVVFEYKK